MKNLIYSILLGMSVFSSAVLHAAETPTNQPASLLSASEQEGILLMREEEKMAHDVYQAMYQKWQQPIFKNIAQSEQSHMAAMKTLIDYYGLTDPIKNQTGQFTNPTLQATYDRLIAKGNNSLQDALLVGAEIEDMDIADLDRLIQTSKQPNIKTVYEQLNRGSRNHMRGFSRQLKRFNMNYTPQHISATQYQQIVSSGTERGYGRFAPRN